MPPTVRRTIAITNRLGMHARPATLFAEVAAKYDSQVQIRRVDSEELIDGKSIMSLLMLAATAGTEIEIIGDGADCECAVNELVDLVKANFHEE